jgi:citrate lyase subunit beta / citryl-CoA lyase
MPQRLRRSVLACPGSNPRMMEKAAASAADEVFLDLEDACAPLEKPGARAKIVDALKTHDWSGKVRVVRINQVTSQYAYRDILDIVEGAGAIVDCIMVPKVQNTGDVAFVDRALTQLEQELGLEPGRIGIEAQIEDAAGLMNVDQIAFASRRVETIIFGPADFSASMQLPSLTVAGGSPDYPGDVFHYVLFRLAVAARAAGIQVIDGPYLAIRDVEGYGVAARKAAALGYDGKWCLHPDQIAPCNQAFTPTQQQFDRAVQILDAYRHATEVERRGAVMLGDDMIDEASPKMATQFFLRGQAAGLTPSAAQEPAGAAS